MIAARQARAFGPRHLAGPDVIGWGEAAAPPGVRARAATRLAAPVALAGGVSALLAIAWVALAPAAAERGAFVPLLLGMVFLGLPHGALDHLVPARMGAAWGRRPPTLALFLAGYAGLAAAFLWLWTVAPAAAFVGFLVATVLHWGQGDVDFLERFFGRRRAGRLGHAAAILLRGALPVTVPVLAQPDVAEALFATAAVATGAAAGGGLDLRAPLVIWGLGIALFALFATYLFGLGRAWHGWRGRFMDVAELFLLAVLFTWVPAYLAIGAYFLAWHSLRHLARLLLLPDAEARAVAEGDLRGPVLRLTRDLIPTTLIALAFLVALTAWSGPRIDGVEGFVALYLVWISALTMPHLAVVAWMDAGPG